MKDENAMYDYIVVGGGSAGAVMATRLTENPQIKVLLLEAGGEDNSIFLRIPLGLGLILDNDNFVWRPNTLPQAKLYNNEMYWPSGKILGGSSSVNGMLAVRGQPLRYDEWAAAGCPGWSAEDVLPAFKKLESYSEGDPEYRGKDGPIKITKASPNPISEAFVASCGEAGFPLCEDYNDQKAEGASRMQMSIRRGKRCSTSRAYLRLARRRPNLRVKTNSIVSSVSFDGDRATGVKYIGPDGAEHSQSVRKEVILCAGAIRSPQILELSGVGDAQLLKKMGIEVVKHNPVVGENLQDHLMPRLNYECNYPYTVNDIIRNKARMVCELMRYGVFRDGLFSTPGVSGTAFVRSRDNLKYPDLRLQVGLTSGTNRTAKSVATGIDDFSGFHIGGYFLYPESRGNIHIASRDPREAPNIDPNYLTQPLDCEVMLRTMRVLRRIAAQPSMSAMIKRATRPPMKSDETDEELLDYARQTSYTCWHPIGTCHMGPENSSVVDHQMRVHGLKGIRVVDASIIPFHVSSNTNIPTIMLAERAAEFIKSSE